ncbi:hypothetical protein BGZ73_006052 [Actinomortierella ambigua]|nr:hypothetical protein BGZ73_006052 [Actinomortierella ambigua]
MGSPVLEILSSESQARGLDAILPPPEPVLVTTWTVDFSFLKSTSTTTGTVAIETTTPSPTQTPCSSDDDKNTGKPLHTLPVQLILGILAMCLIIASILRCYSISWRNHRRLMRERGQRDIEAQRQALAIATAGRRPSRVTDSYINTYPNSHHRSRQQDFPPMTETEHGVAIAGRTTLAARLREYRETAALRSGRVGPPPENGMGTRLTELEDTMPQSTVAPAYHDDVSPPSFLATVGKPPSYEDSVLTPLEHAHQQLASVSRGVRC